MAARRKRRTPAQIAASKRNLEKARAARAKQQRKAIPAEDISTIMKWHKKGPSARVIRTYGTRHGNEKTWEADYFMSEKINRGSKRLRTKYLNFLKGSARVKSSIGSGRR